MSRYQRRQPDDIYAEILCKFIVNLPKEEVKPDRIWYHYQKAFYFYIDHQKKNTKENTDAQKKNFYMRLNRIAPGPFKFPTDALLNWEGHISRKIPVYGAILVNEKKTKVICVVNANQSAKYGFPKGKIDEGESAAMCARREVWEEIGFDVNDRINENQFIKVEDDKKIIQFFVVKDIKEETTVFKTLSETEVRAVEWIPIDPDYPNLVKATRNAMNQLIAHLNPEQKPPRSFFETFLENFKVELSKNIDPPLENPFTTFKFDKEKLLSIFK